MTKHGYITHVDLRTLKAITIPYVVKPSIVTECDECHCYRVASIIMATPAGFIFARWCDMCGINYVLNSDVCDSVLEWRRKWKELGFKAVFGDMMPDALASEHPPMLIGGCKCTPTAKGRKIRKYAGDNPAFKAI